MSRHEGVSCDSCMKSNFTGLRYKCLTCYDYDLCSACYNSGVSSTRHKNDHAMQCILTRSDLNLYYGGDGSASVQPQSYTCAYCGRMGFSITMLQEHVRTNHGDVVSVDVVCPVCAAHPVGDPNHVTNDLATHLALVHRSPAVEFEDDQLSEIKQIRRLTQAARSSNTAGGAGGSAGGRTIRGSLMQLIEPTMSTGSTSANRDLMDPIAELLSHLSSVRGRLSSQGVTSHLQQLEMQLASSNEFSRHQQEHLLHHQIEAKTTSSSAPQTRPTESQSASTKFTSTPATAANAASTPSASTSSRNNPQFLLVRSIDKTTTEMKKQRVEMENADKSLFVQELVLSSMLESSSDIDSKLFLPGTAKIDSNVTVQPAEEENVFLDLADENIRSVHDAKPDDVERLTVDGEEMCNSVTNSYDVKPTSCV